MNNFEFENLPESLRALPCWLMWRLQERGGPKPTKVPYNARGGEGKSDDPATWSTFDVALDRYERGGYTGIGFALNFPMAGADFDDCIDPQTGEIVPWVLEWVRKLDSYTEISPSGRGLRVFFQAALPHAPPVKPDDKPRTGIKRKLRGIGVEIYDGGRFLTTTGWHLEGTPRTVNVRQAQAAEYYRWIEAEDAKQKEAARPQPIAMPERRQVEPTGPAPALSDDEIVTLALNAKNGAKFEALMDGSTSGYASGSEADAALVMMLCFWTIDDAQVERLWKESRLYRAKMERGDYVRRTIANARARQTSHYSQEYGGKANGEKREQIATSEAFLQVVLRSTALWDITAESRIALLSVIALANGRKVFPLSAATFARHIRTRGLETAEEQANDDRMYGWRTLKKLRTELDAKVSYPILTRRERGKWSPNVKKSSVYELDLLPFFRMLEAYEEARDDAETNHLPFKPLKAREDAAAVIAYQYRLSEPLTAARHCSGCKAVLTFTLEKALRCGHCESIIKPGMTKCPGDKCGVNVVLITPEMNSCPNQSKTQDSDELVRCSASLLPDGPFRKWQKYRDDGIAKFERGVQYLVDSHEDCEGGTVGAALVRDCNATVTRVVEAFTRKMPSSLRSKLHIEKVVIKPLREGMVTTQKQDFSRNDDAGELPITECDNPSNSDLFKYGDQAAKDSALVAALLEDDEQIGLIGGVVV